MSLILRETETFDWPVAVQKPLPDGSFEIREFTATFEAVDADAFRELLDLQDDAALLRRALVGWSGVSHADGTGLAFSEENRERLLRKLDVRMAAARAYVDAMLGREYRRKN